MPIADTMFSLIIPAHNEEKTLEELIVQTRQALANVEIIVVDDASSDNTYSKAIEAGAKVFKNHRQIGQSRSTELGVSKSNGDIIITMDADGEHFPEDISTLLQPILDERADLVIGRRSRISRPAEVLLSLVSRTSVGIHDPICGFRTFRRSLYLTIGHFDKRNTCGAEFLLHAFKEGFRVSEVEIRSGVRQDTPRIGGAIKANLRILWLLLKMLILLLQPGLLSRIMHRRLYPKRG